jgi:hypothetical protein
MVISSVTNNSYKTLAEDRYETVDKKLKTYLQILAKAIPLNDGIFNDIR